MNSRVFAPTSPAEAHLPGSGRLATLVRRVERAFDAVCGEADNPLRQLGALVGDVTHEGTRFRWAE